MPDVSGLNPDHIRAPPGEESDVDFGDDNAVAEATTTTVEESNDNSDDDEPMAVDRSAVATDDDGPAVSEPGVVAVNLDESQSEGSVSDISGV